MPPELVTTEQQTLVRGTGTPKVSDSYKTRNQNTHEESSEKKERQYEIIWDNLAYHLVLHVAAIYGVYLGFTSAKLATVLFSFVTYNLGMFGTTAGAHRLWTHQSYKATWQLKCILIFCNTLSYQNHVLHWARDHRTHHKYSDTDADPHNAKRGFFFSHYGWLLVRKHPDVVEKGKTIDISDLTSDWIIRFQSRYYWILMPIIAFIIPTKLPMSLWNETFVNAFFLNVARFLIELHCTFLINSAAHAWGNKPYDKNIKPTEDSFLSFVTWGEGWHNYHHVFPWDYRASEFGTLNATLLVLNFFAKIGWAYDLKTTPKELIGSRAKRTGDGSRETRG